jgi:NAD+ diphosphatase
MIAFAGNPLDRASDRRSDPDWLRTIRADTRVRVLPLWKLQPLMLGPETARETTTLGFIDGTLASGLGAHDAVEVFLGLDGEIGYFARDISALANPLAAALASLGHFRDARAAASLLPAPEVAIMGQAKAMIDWHDRHGHCARCGAATEMADGGHRRACPNCKAEHFPRTDPVVIMLVATGDHCLLARNKRFLSGHYSTLAGFVEPGETLEEAVRREVFEEVRIPVGTVRYFGCQPWPFPSNLMLGCFAEAAQRDIAVDGNEILAARWFDRETVQRLVAGKSHEVGLPRREAIAFHLIETWARGA